MTHSGDFSFWTTRIRSPCQDWKFSATSVGSLLIWGWQQCVRSNAGWVECKAYCVSSSLIIFDCPLLNRLSFSWKGKFVTESFNLNRLCSDWIVSYMGVHRFVGQPMTIQKWLNRSQIFWCKSIFQPENLWLIPCYDWHILTVIIDRWNHDKESTAGNKKYSAHKPPFGTSGAIEFVRSAVGHHCPGCGRAQ